MNARRTLFLLIAVAMIALLLSLILALRLQRVVAVTNGLIVAESTFNEWRTSGDGRLDSLTLQRELSQALPDALGPDQQSTREWLNFLSEPQALPDQAEAEELQSVLIWELFECHRLQNQYSAWVNLLQVALSVIILAIALVAYFMGRRAQDYRLAPFPELNPNPVFGLNGRGDIIYTNSAVAVTAGQYLGPGETAVQLLPGDYRERLLQMKTQQQLESVWIASVHGHTFQHKVQRLPSADRVHVYSEDITEQEEVRARNAFIATHDPVCLLANRERLEQVVEDCRAPDQALTLVLTFVSGLSPVIATLGVNVGDQFARELSMRLRLAYQSLRLQEAQPPLVFRLDTNLFGCLYFHRLPPPVHQQLKTALTQTVELPFEFNEREFYFQLQSGAATDQTPISARDLIQQANLALHALKDEDQTYRVYDVETESAIQNRARMEQALRKAIDQNELHMAYQPQLTVDGQSLIGFEALLRWQHDGQTISPGVFIPLAESTGLIHRLGHWAMRTVFEQVLAWSKSEKATAIGTVAVNVSVEEFTRRDFIEELEVALAEFPVDCGRIQLELTESLFIADERAALERMHQLKSMGFTLAIDDFGTGYSSFSYLSRFPVDKLKIDRSFVVRMTRSRKDEALVAAMIDVAHQLEMSVIAEGVETDAEREVLERLGCDQVQGFLYGRPMQAVEAAEFISARTEVL